MTASAPAEAAVDLHNQLVALPLADQEAIGRIVWQARKLAREVPGNFSIRLLFAMALVRAGQRDEAFREGTTAYNLRGQADEGLAELAQTLAGLGDVERSIQVAREICSKPGTRVDNHAQTLASITALHAGDADLLKTVASLEGDQSSCFGSRVLQSLEKAKLLPFLSAHQQRVRDILQGTMMLVDCMIDDMQDPGTVTLRYHVTGDFSHRLALKRAVDASLRDLYRGTTLGEAPYVNAFVTMISGYPKKAESAAA